ncbi:MAG: gamma-glutamyl-gamma-aminobutyrate hydrolase family protein [Bryobacteraceae bacterium]
MTQRVLIPYRHSKKVKAYEDAARAGGVEAAPVPTAGRVSLNGFAGLLLMGGTDVNPKCYGEAAQPETERPDDERDEVELELIHDAIEKDLPILAICRGLQILNVYHGGTLIQHLSGAERHDPGGNRALPVHAVTIEPDSLLADIAGAGCWQVNSSHHQAAGKIGAGLRVSARDSEDGTVEALERPDKRFVVAVQWHPEDQVSGDLEQLKLFRGFADALRD